VTTPRYGTHETPEEHKERVARQLRAERNEEIEEHVGAWLGLGFISLLLCAAVLLVIKLAMWVFQ
jgi:hypothetical protein